MFTKNKYDEYELVINDIRFVCDSAEDGLEDTATKIAAIYESKVVVIANYMLEKGLSDYFGDLYPGQVLASLGKPTIDLDRCLLMYLEQAFDDTHIIEIEYAGMLDEFYYLNIDG